ncbi:MAG: mannose-1-phosphate guanylyltransferase [Gemmatimonadetes bacterium]|nr:mannose-1-phosphate guanylyltransferase [Gemmatimonadota bacterium]
MPRWAAVLAGGSGTRFWPLSTSDTPKQMLPLVGRDPLLVQTVTRLHDLIAPERVLIITGEHLAARTRALLPGLPWGNVLTEPRAASTGPALAWATAVAAGRDASATILAMHADWFVGDDDAFRASAAQALEVAERHDVLVTVGVVPTRVDVGYGYIIPGDPMNGGARRVARFVEKPDAGRAAELIKAGALWNSGLFAWTAARFFAETDAVAPEIAPHVTGLRQGDVAGFFREVKAIAVDVSHFERSRRVAVVAGEFPWDDVGTWGALARVRPRDADGNVVVGDVAARSARGCVLWSDEGPVVVDGVEGLVVVRANGITLVTTVERAQSLKELLEALPARVRGT